MLGDPVDARERLVQEDGAGGVGDGQMVADAGGICPGGKAAEVVAKLQPVDGAVPAGR